MAEGWQSVLSSHPYGPEKILAIDKTSQTFFMLRRHSPLAAEKIFPCTTGQADGDKQVQGDLRTPEGVYFIGYKVDRNLGWDLYGNLAYTLNYPNPVDRLKGKTGSGIWLHGRGKELVPRDTRGCIALKVPDLKSLSRDIVPGLPVLIASRVSWNDAPGSEGPLARSLTGEVRAWARNWQLKSDDFFAHYDADKLDKVERTPFSAFVAHKKNVFASQPWIQVMVANVHAAQGPDYWVTWFDQYYRTPSLTSQVGKRFYWQRDPAGEWRIMGREYTPPSQDLSGLYLEAKTKEVESFLSSWSTAWQAADISGYVAHYAQNARQSKRSGLSDIAEFKRKLWAEKPPKLVRLGRVKVKKHPQGLAATFEQTYEDRTGYRDVGDKTLVLTPAGDGWAIVSETWRRS